jgi:hypothetical protein
METARKIVEKSSVSSEMGIAGLWKRLYLCSRYEENDIFGSDDGRHGGGTGH